MPTKKNRPKPKKPPYDVVWNGERGRYDVFVDSRMIGFHRFKAARKRWVSERPSQPAKVCSVCGEPSVAVELPLDGCLVRATAWRRNQSSKDHPRA
jgi:hypothetical protein